MVKLLFAYGANLNHKNSEYKDITGLTPLELGLEKRHFYGRLNFEKRK